MAFSNNPFIPDPPQARKPCSDEALIFLDFDGVVHPRPEGAIPTTWEEIEAGIGEIFFLETPVRQVIRLCETLDARIVLSTSWRNLGFDLEKFNPIFAGHIIGQTPEVYGRLGEAGRREKEIRSYLDEFQLTSRYAIIDDKTHNFSENTSRLFLTDPQECLTEKIADNIIRCFDG